jgi:hypothetical protein
MDTSAKLLSPMTRSQNNIRMHIQCQPALVVQFYGQRFERILFKSKQFLRNRIMADSQKIRRPITADSNDFRPLKKNKLTSRCKSAEGLRNKNT